MSRWPRSPIFYGIVVAVVAAVAGQWLGVSPPAAYGLCSACHGRDLVNWILNHDEGTGLFVTAAGAGWPLFTVVGVVLGSFLAARRNGEFGSINLGGNVAPVRVRRGRDVRRAVRRRLPDAASSSAPATATSRPCWRSAESRSASWSRPSRCDGWRGDDRARSRRSASARSSATSASARACARSAACATTCSFATPSC